MMENLTVVIPVHSVSGDFRTYFDRAMNSIKEQVVKPERVMIVRCACIDVINELKNIDFNQYVSEDGIKSVEIVENARGKDFQTQMTVAVENVATEYFSFLEFDDEYSKSWFKNVKKYIRFNSDVDVFLPIIVDVDPNETFIGTTNEPVWGMNFSNTMGLVDNDLLKDFYNFNIDGMVMKTSLFKELGGIKKNFKLTFNYEFLLRLTYNGYKVMVIPKYGYKHTNMRENSLYHKYRYSPTEKIDTEEAAFWVETAKKEMFFDPGIERTIVYSAK